MRCILEYLRSMSRMWMTQTMWLKVMAEEQMACSPFRWFNFYIIGLKHNLISVAMLSDAQFWVDFNNKHNYFLSQDRSKCFIASGRNENMYHLDIDLMIGKPQLWFLAKVVSDVRWLWHRHLPHYNFKYINNLVIDELVWGMSLLMFDSNTLYVVCDCGKISTKDII